MRSDKPSRWARKIVGLVLVWFLFINGLYYWNTLGDYGPEILDRLGIDWLR